MDDENKLLKNFPQIERQIISMHKRTEAQMSDSAIRSITVEDTRLDSYYLCSVC